MGVVTDFYKFKYRKDDYYLDVFINKGVIPNIESALNEILSDRCIPKDSQCAYMKLKELFQKARKSTSHIYVEIKIHKCYLRYINNLYLYFFDRKEYRALKELSDYFHLYIVEDIENISNFITLSEDVKIRILSNI